MVFVCVITAPDVLIALTITRGAVESKTKMSHAP
jgi:hypothetical protein